MQVDAVGAVECDDDDDTPAAASVACSEELDDDREWRALSELYIGRMQHLIQTQLKQAMQQPQPAGAAGASRKKIDADNLCVCTVVLFVEQ